MSDFVRHESVECESLVAHPSVDDATVVQHVPFADAADGARYSGCAALQLTSFSVAANEKETTLFVVVVVVVVVVVEPMWNQRVGWRRCLPVDKIHSQVPFFAIPVVLPLAQFQQLTEGRHAGHRRQSFSLVFAHLGHNPVLRQRTARAHTMCTKALHNTHRI